jgi:hypothetical protein
MPAQAASVLAESATVIARQVRSGALRAEHHIGQVLDAIRARDGAINAFSEVSTERALRKARSIDAEVAAGVTRSSRRPLRPESLRRRGLHAAGPRSIVSCRGAGGRDANCTP